MERRRNVGKGDAGTDSQIPQITDDEIRKTVGWLKEGNTADAKGMLMQCDETRDMIRNTLNVIIEDGTQTPMAWRHALIKVLSKKKTPPTRRTTGLFTR